MRRHSDQFAPPPAVPAPPASRARAGLLVVSILLAALTLLAFSPILSNGFVALDDGEYITTNNLVLRGLTLEGIRDVFLTTTRTHIWHPLTWLSHMTDVELFGLRAGAHHAVSLVLHVGNALLLFALLRALTGALWRSALVAALFAVHPLHVESVAWASERKDVLSTFFLLTTAHAYVRAARRDAVRTSLAVPALYALALLSKSMTVTLPFLLLLLDWWPLGRWEPSRRRPGPLLGASGLLPPVRLWIEKAPLFLFAAAAAAVTVRAQAAGGIVAPPLHLFYLLNALLSYVRYLGKTLWPHPLYPFYPMPTTWPPLAALVGSVALLTVVTVVVVRAASRRPHLAVGWFWYLGVLVPVIGLVQSGAQAMADRYTYHSLTGVFIAVVWGLGEPAARRPRLRAGLAAGSLAVLAALTPVTRAQAARWKDNVTLFGYATWVDNDNWMALNILGAVLKDQGRMEEAAEHFRQSLAINENSADAHLNLGIALYVLGRSEEALEHLERSRAIRPAGPIVNRALGQVLLQLGRSDEALERLREAVALDPHDHVAHALLGTALARRGLTGEADRSLAEARRLAPRDPTVLFSSGAHALAQGREAEALAAYGELARTSPGELALHATVVAALESHQLGAAALAHLGTLAAAAPESAAVQRQVGEALFERGRFSEAADHLRRATEADGSDAGLFNNYGAALAQTGDLPGAVAAIRRSLALDPGSVEARLNLGSALLGTADLDGAAEQILEAYSLAPADPRIGPAIEDLLRARGGEEALTRVGASRPWPKGLPARRGPKPPPP